MSLERYFNIVFNKFIRRYKCYTYFLQNESNFRNGNPRLGMKVVRILSVQPTDRKVQTFIW
jgi:hypothetical protein